jgi:hypothetical protein
MKKVNKTKKYKRDEEIESEIEKSIMNYLIQTIDSGRFKIKDLTFKEIKKRLKGFEEKKIEKVLDRLQESRHGEDAKIVTKQSTLKLYIPSTHLKDKKLMDYELGNPLDYLFKSYFLGIIALIIIISFMPQEKFLTIFGLILVPNSNFPIILLLFFLIFGFLGPVIIGLILMEIISFLRKLISRIFVLKTIEIGAAKTMGITTFIILGIYIISSIYLNFKIEPYQVITVMGVGIAVGGAIWNYVIKKKK